MIPFIIAGVSLAFMFFKFWREKSIGPWVLAILIIAFWSIVIGIIGILAK